MNIFKAIINSLFPLRCVLCGNLAKKDDYKCQRCTIPNKPLIRNLTVKPGVRGKKPHNLTVFSPTYYVGFYRKSLHLFKFKKKTIFAESYAKLILDMNLVDKTADFITFVPMTKRQIRERGYNQAEVLARKISKLSNVPIKELLIKTVETEAQHTLKFSERKKNLRGIYSVTEDVKDLNIIIVDDIITTGSTLCECAATLYRKGAKNVIGLCAADTQSKLTNDII